MTRRATFRRDDSGAVLVEFGLVLALFVLILFGLIDFGRLGFSYVMAEKATQRAVRIASVRLPVCPGLPLVHLRGTRAAARYGVACATAAGNCAAPATVSCSGDAGNATAAEIWAEVRPLVPVNTRIENLRFFYSSDPALGFLGGPYTPVVTVEITDLTFQFISPLGALARLAGAGATDTRNLGEDFAFPTMSSSLPAEDLS